FAARGKRRAVARRARDAALRLGEADGSPDARAAGRPVVARRGGSGRRAGDLRWCPGRRGGDAGLAGALSERSVDPDVRLHARRVVREAQAGRRPGSPRRDARLARRDVPAVGLRGRRERLARILGAPLTASPIVRTVTAAALQRNGPEDDTEGAMWSFLSRLGGKPGGRDKSLDSVFRELSDGDAARPKPTLVCRACGLKYENTGTYLQGSRCPTCHPNG